MKRITSPAHPLVKRIARLHKRSGGDILLEGTKLVNEALDAGVRVEHAIIAEALAQTERGREILTRLEEADIVPEVVPERLFRRLSGQESPEGILLVASRPSLPLARIAGDVVVVLVGVQDPGNLGAVARVAEAAGASALVACRGSADPFQPKALRGAMGSLLRLPVSAGEDPDSVLRALGKAGYRRAALTPRRGVDYREADLLPPVAVILGSESRGLSASLLDRAEVKISIPMKPPVESLNVAVSAGLVLYEILRRSGGKELFP